jgi:hypothetical protein
MNTVMFQTCYNTSLRNYIIQVHYDKIHRPPFSFSEGENERDKYPIVITSVNKQFYMHALSNRNFTIQKEELTMTVVTTAFTSPL